MRIRIRDIARRANLRMIIVNPTTMTIVDDTSMRFDAIGKRFTIDAPDDKLQQLYGDGIEGKKTIPGEGVAFLYVAHNLQFTPLKGALQNKAPTATNYIVVLAQQERDIRAFLSTDLRDYLGPAALIALVVSLILAYGLARSISRPIARLS